MRIVVVAATGFEIVPLLDRLRGWPATPPDVVRAVYQRHEVEVLITGVGMVQTAAWCSRALATTHYDLALNVGVCGSFDPSIPPGDVVHVVRDQFAELGAEDGEQFLTMQDLGLIEQDDFPFENGQIKNAAPPQNAALKQLPEVSAITVNTVHGNERSIAAVTRRFSPQVESMEGAAFMYACRINGVPFAQVRAVSNIVARRHRESWKMKEAIANLGATTLSILDQA